MIPITRKENYLNEIVGWGNTAPEKPLTPEEFFFAAILGEAVQTPEPLSRYQIYLAKIAGRNISVPKPLTRLELFLAKACGMDIETPTPITREEIFWSNYTAIVEFEVEGVPPLTYKAIEGTLKNYRIYGNTVNGENVGDLITEGEHAGEYSVPVTVEGKNLFYITKFTNNDTQSTSHGVNFSIIDNEVYANGTSTGMYPQVIGFDSVLTEWETYAATLYIEGEYTGLPYIYCTTAYDSTGNYKIVRPNVRTIFTALPNTRFVFITQGTGESFNIKYKLLITKATIEDDTYEPYHAPITTPIYLPKPIKMVGDEAEYIDYAEQKMHVDADEEIEKQAATYMVSITPKTDVSKIVFVTMSSVPDDCTILISGLIFTLDEADANTLNSTNYADGVRGHATTTHNYKYTWTKKYTEGETYYIRSYVKYQTADNEIKEVYGDVYKADINGFERVRKNLHVTLPALPTLPGTNVLSVGTAVQPSKVYVKYKGERQ